MEIKNRAEKGQREREGEQKKGTWMKTPKGVVELDEKSRQEQSYRCEIYEENSQ